MLDKASFPLPMLASSSAQLALINVLRQRLAAAGCAHGRLEVSAPEAYLSLSGQTDDGKTFYFWEFSQHFHQLLAAYLQEQSAEYPAHLIIQLEVATGQAQYLRAPKAVAPTTLDPTPYGLALAAQVAARLDYGATLVPSGQGYGGMGLASGAAGYQYGEVWDGVLLPQRTFPSWATFVAWLAAQSDFSLALPPSESLNLRAAQTITRQQLLKLGQRSC